MGSFKDFCLDRYHRLCLVSLLKFRIIALNEISFEENRIGKHLVAFREGIKKQNLLVEDKTNIFLGVHHLYVVTSMVSASGKFFPISYRKQNFHQTLVIVLGLMYIQNIC